MRLWYLVVAALLILFIGVDMSTLSLEPKQNIALVKKISSEVFSDKPVLAQLCLAQAILESRLQSTPSKLAFKYNNLFGIKARGTKGIINLLTEEQDKTGKVKKDRYDFGWNASVEDSIKQYRYLMENGTSDKKDRYHKVLEAETFEEAATEIRKAGFATDISYTKQLLAIYEKVIKKL